VANRLHYLKVVEADWAREGTHVLKVYADGRKYGTSSDYAFRSEVAPVQDEYVFHEGDYHFYTMSFWPDRSWDQVSKYSCVISQWKMSPGLPHAALRLSNLGDYKLTFRGYDLWEGETDEGKFIAYATPRAWNDIKVYAKWSMGSDGFIKVWLNGTQVFEHQGRTLLKRTDRGYCKWGMYTEIRDERTLYFDAVRFSNFLDVPLETWIHDQANLPTISLVQPSQEAHLPSGSDIVMTANASDAGGKKFGAAGEVVKVEFFAGECSLGVADPVQPIPTVTATLPDGPYALTAVATDSDGNTATSHAVDIFVGNKPPDVVITTPLTLSNLKSGSSIAIQAEASDTDGSVSKVVFFAGDEELGVARDHQGLVYSVTWTPTGGAYSLRAVAYDDGEKSSQSEPVRVTVDATVAATSVTAVQDASLLEKDPTKSANWGTVEVYGKPGACITGIFQFDVSSYLGSPEIRAAQLQLFAKSVKEDGGEFAVFGTRPDSDWTEDSVTWAGRPRKADRLAAQVISRKGQYYNFDVTQYVSDSVTGGAERLTFWLEDEHASYSKVEFDSHIKSNPPRLEVTTSSIALTADDEPPAASSDGATRCQGSPRPSAAPRPASSTTTGQSTSARAAATTSTTSGASPPASGTTPCPEVSGLREKVQAIADELSGLAR